jgi:hypothetical protein
MLKFISSDVNGLFKPNYWVSKLESKRNQSSAARVTSVEVTLDVPNGPMLCHRDQ